MRYLNLLLIGLGLCLVAACASNKKTGDASPSAERDAVSENMVSGSVMAQMFIIRNVTDGAEVRLEAEVMKVVKNGPQSPVLNEGERITLSVLKNELQDELPEAGDQITALIIHREIINVGEQPRSEWELSEIYE